MKIICDNCRTKYSIADEKVQGKVFKIRCKKCQNIIVVRGNQGGAEESSQAAPEEEVGRAADSKEAPVWHLVVGREQVGPMTGAEVRERFGRGDIDAESYVWREGFSDWQRLTSIADFADLGQAAAVGAEFESEAPAAWNADADGGGEAAAWNAAPEPAASAWDASGGQTGESAWTSSEDTARADSANLFGGSGGLESGRDLFSSQHGQDPAGELGSFNAAAASPAAAPAGGLFGAAPAASGSDMFAAAPGSNGGQQVFPADDQGAASNAQMTGQRHENSVLFSLSNLQALAMGGKSSPTVAPSSGTGADGSGLIDIRSMAFPSGAQSSSAGSMDELPDLGGFSAPMAAAPVLMPSLVEERPKWILPTVIGLGGLLVVTLVVLVVVLAFRKPVEIPVAATIPTTPTPPPTAPVAKEPEKPAAAESNDTKVAEAKTDDTKGTKARPGKAGGRRGGGKAGKTKGAVAVAQADPEPASSSGGARKPARKGDELDALIDGAIGGGGGKKATRKAPAAAVAAGGGGGGGGGGGANLPDTLSRADIQGGMRKIKDRVQGCYDKFRVPGTAFVQVTISQAGAISAAKVKGMFAGTPTGACLQAAARSASFPRFKGAPITIDYPFILR